MNNSPNSGRAATGRAAAGRAAAGRAAAPRVPTLPDESGNPRRGFPTAAGRPVNVGTAERLAAGALAGALFISILRKPTPLKLLSLGCLVYRATQGHCYGYEWLGVRTCQLPERP